MAEGNSGLGALKLQLGLDSGDFNQSVAKINRQLKVVQSEFEAVNQGTKEYAQSIDGLSAKNSMLTRQLGLQETKVKELKRRYDEAKKATGENSVETQKLMTQYNKALGAMTKTEAQIRQVSDALNDMERPSRNAQESLQNFGDRASTIGGNLSATVTPAIAGIGGALIKVADDAEGSVSRIQRVLGITKEEAEDLNEISRDLWLKGMGENMEEVDRGLLSVRQNMKGLSEDELSEVTKNALYLSKVFDEDVNMVTRAGNNLMENFGITSSEALDLMAHGGQNGLNFSQEMFDNLAEYSPLFADMGFSAEEYFQLLEKGSEAGVYSLDYVNDAIKELQIRLKDGSKTTGDAMGDLSADTQEVFKQFNLGKKSVKDVHNAILKDLQNMDNQVLANRLGVDLYGTKWEDLEADAMYALGGIDGGLEDLDGAMERSGDAVEKTFGERVKIAFREAQDAFEPLGEMLLEVAEKVLPKLSRAIKDVADWWNELSDPMKDFTMALGGITLIAPPVLMAVGGISKAMSGLAPVIGGIVTRLGGAGLAGALAGLGAPVAGALAILAGLGLGYVALDTYMQKPINQSDKFAGKVSSSTEQILGDYDKLETEAQASLIAMATGNEEVTDNHINRTIKKYQEMTAIILRQLDMRYQEERAKLVELLNQNSTLTNEDKAKTLAEFDEHYNQERTKLEENEAKKLEIVKNMNGLNKEEKLKAYEESLKIDQENSQIMLENTAKTKDEYLAIQRNLKDQAGILSAEKAGKFVADSKRITDNVVSEANKQATEEIALIEYRRDVTGEISEDTANALISDAERRRNETVSQAEDEHYAVVKQAQQQAGEHVNEVDWQTGSVMSKWDAMWNRIADVWNPIAEMFNLDQMTKRGVYRVNRRQRLADQGAKIVGRATGTPNGQTHEGGLALVGEEGAEMAYIPQQGYTMLGVGGQQIVDLPKGSSVLPNKFTNRIMKYYGFPAYADGVGDFDIFDIFTKGAKNFWNGALEKSGLFSDVIMPSWFPSTRKIMSKISGGIIEKLDDAVDDMFSFDFGGGRGALMAQQAITQALKITGKPMSWLQPMMTIAQKESGFNPKAINLWDINAQRGIPSKGLFQTIEPTFNAYKMSGMNDIYNPLHSAVSAIRYMDSRYGGVFGHPGIKSMARGGGYLPYAEGGVVNQEQVALLGEDNKEEVVIPLDRYKDRSMDLLAYANLKLGVFERFESFFKDLLSTLKQSTETLISNMWDQTDVLVWRLEAITPTVVSSTDDSVWKEQTMKLRALVEDSVLDDDSFYVNSLLSFKEGGVQAEDGSYVMPSFYGLPERNDVAVGNVSGMGANISNTYQINVSYSGSTQGADVSQLAREIRRELERQDQLNSRSYGVVI